jgi:hypothetical protein
VIRAILVAGVMLASTIACAADDTRPPASPAAFELPTHDGGPGCRDVGIDAVLAGDPGDPWVAWLEDVNSSGVVTRINVAWPPGSTARFVPDLEVVNSDGRVLMRAGDRVTGACVGAGGVLNIK